MIQEQSISALTTQDLSSYYIWMAPYSHENRSWPLNQVYPGSGSSFSKNQSFFFLGSLIFFFFFWLGLQMQWGGIRNVVVSFAKYARF
jgi:hypothetical protein